MSDTLIVDADQVLAFRLARSGLAERAAGGLAAAAACPASDFVRDAALLARIAPAMNALSEAPVYIDDTPNISAMELRTKARRLQAENGLDLVIVDYLQLMQATTTNRDANRVQEVSEISRGLKALARELSVPVIALARSTTANSPWSSSAPTSSRRPAK